MYWPTSAARIFGVPSPLADEPLTRVRPSRRGNLFATLSDRGLGVWDTRPTVLQAAVVRSRESLERWGVNKDVFWSYDSRGLVILVGDGVAQLTTDGHVSFVIVSARADWISCVRESCDCVVSWRRGGRLSHGI